MNTLELDGKIFILTGASRGIGAATALELAKRGATVIGPHRDPGKESRANEVVKEAETAGGKMIALVADVTKPEDRAKLLQITSQQFGKIDGIIFNHAGGLEKGADLGYSLEVNGHAKLALFEESRRSGILKDRALFIDIPSLWSKFYFTGVKQMEVYEPVARGKKLGEKLLKEAIRAYNDEAAEGSHIKFGSVCGQGVGGTITMRRLERLYPKEVVEIRQTSEGGKLPEISDMAQAIASMAAGNFRDEEVMFVGTPQITEDEMPEALPMYNAETRYIRNLLVFDSKRAFGFYPVQEKDTKTPFTNKDGLLIHTYRGKAILDVTENHNIGHFTPEFGLSLFAGNKIVAAAIEVEAANLENSSDITNPRLMAIDGPIDFMVPVFAEDRLIFDSIAPGIISAGIGNIEVARVAGLRFELRDIEQPSGITPNRIIEAGALTLGAACKKRDNLNGVLPLFGRIEGPVEFIREVFPGELLEMEAVLTGEGNKEFQGDVTFRVDDEVVARVFGYACQLRAQKAIERGIRMLRRVLG